MADHYQQYHLSSGDSELTCWLKHDRRVKVGTWITLKEIPDRHWRVEQIFETRLDKPPMSRWEVGGLG